MRFQNSLKNFIVSWSGQIIYTLVLFISRSYFIRILGSEYLGISSLFSNILSMLSLAELGIGTAICFSLYEPLEKNNKEKIKSLVRIFRKTYFVIGCIILFSGILLAPFIQYFISEIPQDIFTLNDIRLYFILYVINIAFNYFYSARSVLITADQKNYIVNLNQYFWNIICLISQTILLYLTRNYILYLIIQIICTIIQNIIINRISLKLYPYLKENANKLSSNDLNHLKKYIFATVCHKIGGVLVNSTDNLIISKFLGLLTVGQVTNYTTIISTITTFMGKIFNAISASVGNFTVSNVKDKSFELFNNVYFLGFWVYSFSAVSLFCLLDPFITLWLGKDYIINIDVVIVLCLNFYINGMRQVVLTFRDSMGLFWNDRYKPLFEASFNLIVSIILVQFVGLKGVYIGTLLTYICIDLPIEPLILYRNGFSQSALKYHTKYFKYVLVTLISCLLCKYSCFLISNNFNGILAFIFQCFVIVIMHNAIILLLYRKSNSMNFIWNKIKSIKKGVQ